MPSIITRGGMSAGGFGHLSTIYARDPNFSSVTLLMEAAAGGIADLSSAGNTVTASGSAVVSSTQSKFGGSSFFCPAATNGSFKFSGTPLSLGSGDWTLECWVYLTARAELLFMGGSASEAANTLSWYMPDTGGTMRADTGTTQIVVSAQTIPAATWTFITITKGSGTVRMYVNGNVDANTGTDSTTFTSNSGTGSAAARVGQSTATFGAGADFYIDQIRATVGVARYSTTFTPPTAVFPTH